MPRTLGLDLGTNSIGWVLVRDDGDGAGGAMEGCGVRIFEEAVDAKTGAPSARPSCTAQLQGTAPASRRPEPHWVAS